MGIPGAQPYRRWHPDEIELLGASPDREVARRLGRTVYSVKRKRWALGIPAAEGRSR
jgi:hypothetical protein